jgi:hypothetical protein
MAAVPSPSQVIFSSTQAVRIANDSPTLSWDTQQVLRTDNFSPDEAAEEAFNLFNINFNQAWTYYELVSGYLEILKSSLSTATEEERTSTGVRDFLNIIATPNITIDDF